MFVGISNSKRKIIHAKSLTAIVFGRALSMAEVVLKSPCLKDCQEATTRATHASGMMLLLSLRYDPHLGPIRSPIGTALDD